MRRPTQTRCRNTLFAVLASAALCLAGPALGDKPEGAGGGKPDKHQGKGGSKDRILLPGGNTDRPHKITQQNLGLLNVKNQNLH